LHSRCIDRVSSTPSAARTRTWPISACPACTSPLGDTTHTPHTTRRTSPSFGEYNKIQLSGARQYSLVRLPVLPCPACTTPCIAAITTHTDEVSCVSLALSRRSTQQAACAAPSEQGFLWRGSAAIVDFGLSCTHSRVSMLSFCHTHAHAHCLHINTPPPPPPHMHSRPRPPALPLHQHALLLTIAFFFSSCFQRLGEPTLPSSDWRDFSWRSMRC
jgi:hypothetical protein